MPPSVPTNVLIQYTMVGQLQTNTGPNAYQPVYWDVFNAPDFAGTYSGYVGQLQNITIAATVNVSSPASDLVIPTGPAGGDLSGSYPNPQVAGILGSPVVGSFISGQTLVYNGHSFVPGTLTGGAAGGDLAGSYPSPQVIALRGIPIIGSPSNGQTLVYNGTNWVPGGVAGSAAGGDLSGTYPNPTVAKINGIAIVGSPATGQTLVYNGTNWVPGTNGAATAGGDLAGSYPNPEVTGLFGVPMSAAASTPSQVLQYNGSTWAPTSPPWITQLSGDGTAVGAGSVTLTVTRVNGISYPAGPLTAGNVPVAVASGLVAYGPINLGGGANYVSGTLPVTNFANGTAGQVLVTNSGATAPAWVSVQGDLQLQASGTGYVQSISGHNGAGGGITLGDGTHNLQLIESGATSLSIQSGSLGFAFSVNGAANWCSVAGSTTDYAAFGGPATGAGRVAGSGIIRVPASFSLPLIACRDLGNTTDVGVLSNYTITGTNQGVHVGSAGIYEVGVVASNDAFVAAPSFGHTTGSGVSWTEQQQGTAGAQAGQVYRYVGLGSVTTSVPATLLTIPLPLNCVATITTKFVTRATSAPTSGAVGDAGAVVAAYTFKSVAGTVSQVGSATTLSTQADTHGLTTVNAGSGSGTAVFQVNVVASGAFACMLTADVSID